VVSLSQGRTAAAQCGLFTHKSVPVIFEPPCIFKKSNLRAAYLKCLHRVVLRVLGHIYNRVQSISRKLRDTGHVRLSCLHIPFGLSTYPTENKVCLNYKD